MVFGYNPATSLPLRKQCPYMLGAYPLVKLKKMTTYMSSEALKIIDRQTDKVGYKADVRRSLKNEVL